MLGVGRGDVAFPRVCLGRPPEGPWDSRHLSPVSLRRGERKGGNAHCQENPLSKYMPSCELALPSVSQSSLICMDPPLQFYTPRSGKVQG